MTTKEKLVIGYIKSCMTNIELGIENDEIGNHILSLGNTDVKEIEIFFFLELIFDKLYDIYNVKGSFNDFLIYGDKNIDKYYNNILKLIK